ncbi:MAG: VCBS repeat-containing protein, partial [Cyclobacteriaceae bacterium]|nr:VCBS repeat-containing protein [Cyclobacteriaceae bacterium]
MSIYSIINMRKLNSFFKFFISLALFATTNFIQAQSPVNSWSYIEIDNNKSKWGDYDDPNWLRYFGLDMGDLNGDGLKDILTGRWIYLNPGTDMSGDWTKVDIGINADGILVMDVDGDEYGDIIAQA